METAPSLPKEVLNAFHLMWGNFPEGVSLVHKSRQVMAVNKAMEKMGVVRPGMNCAKVGSPEAHKGCLANKFVPLPLPGRDAVSFWIPLGEYPDFFLHFSVGLRIDYKTGQQIEYNAS